jgi:acetolactate synthase-1/2/3 large subunit
MDSVTKTKNEIGIETSPEKELTGAEMVVLALIEQGVEHVFGYPGGAVLPLYDAFEKSDIRHTLVSHEQGAVHAADAYARATGRTGVVFVTSGPGATNTVTGIQNAYADSSPIVVITGQVATALLGTNAFQECDIVGITKPCTKQNYLVRNAADLPHILREAFSIAQSGRPGPVLIDIPKDVQLARGFYKAAKNNMTAKARDFGGKITQAVAMMRAAERPVFYTGGGVNRSGFRASEALRELTQETGFPVTSTLMGLGAYPASGQQWLGMLGMHGTFEANMAMHNADLIVAIGARFDDRVTGDLKGFSPGAKIVHIDIDPQSIGKIVPAHLGIEADCGEAMSMMLEVWRAGNDPCDLSAWRNRIDEWRGKNSLAYENSETVIKPQYVMQKLNELVGDKDVFIVTDVGQNQMWAAQYLRMEKPNRLITSGGLGTMGFGLPAALGVQAAYPGALVICVCGDGGFQMTSPEMATAVEENLWIKVLILNNKGLGMVRQWNGLIYESRYSASTSKSQPDFGKLAEAYKWGGLGCSLPHEVEGKMRELLDMRGPCLLDCRTDPGEDCFPMFRLGGKGHSDMIFAPKKA